MSFYVTNLGFVKGYGLSGFLNSDARTCEFLILLQYLHRLTLIYLLTVIAVKLPLEILGTNTHKSQPLISSHFAAP